MKKNTMKRILPFLLIALLISCTNQQTDDNTADAKEEKQALSVQELEPDKITEEEVDKKNTEALTLDISGESSKLNQEWDSETAFLFNRGTTAYRNDDFESGVGFFEQIVANTPDNRKAYYNLGLGYFELGRYYDALQAFNSAIEISPNDSISIQYRGRVYYMLGDFPKCLKDYDRVVQMKPDDPIAWYNRGTAHGQLKNYLGAIKDFDKAIELDPDYAEAFFNRGLANYFQGRMHEACYDWRKAHGLGHYEAEKAIRSYCEGSD